MNLAVISLGGLMKRIGFNGNENLQVRNRGGSEYSLLPNVWGAGRHANWYGARVG